MLTATCAMPLSEGLDVSSSSNEPSPMIRGLHDTFTAKLRLKLLRLWSSNVFSVARTVCAVAPTPCPFWAEGKGTAGAIRDVSHAWRPPRLDKRWLHCTQRTNGTRYLSSWSAASRPKPTRMEGAHRKGLGVASVGLEVPCPRNERPFWAGDERQCVIGGEDDAGFHVRSIDPTG